MLNVLNQGYFAYKEVNLSLLLLKLITFMLTHNMFLFFSLGPLVNKVKEFQVETIVDTLCSNMISDKEQLRDISSIGKLSLAFHLLCISIPISSIYWDVKYWYLPVVIQYFPTNPDLLVS